MMQVAFHTGMPDKFMYAARLLRKAWRSGSRVVVAAPEADLAPLDKLLWTFEPTEFLPHVMQPRGAAVAARLAGTPVCLVAVGDEPPHHDVLVNLGADMVPGFETFRRVIELASRDASDMAAGRVRWKHYLDRGYDLKLYKVEA